MSSCTWHVTSVLMFLVTGTLAATAACERSTGKSTAMVDATGSGAPDSGVGAGPRVDPRALDVVREMSRLLSGSTGFALDAEETIDELPIDGLRHQISNRRRVALRRPDRLAGDVTGDTLNRSFTYDGRVFTISDRVHHTYTRLSVPPTLDEALDSVFERADMVIPLADFLYDDPYLRMTEGILRGAYLGIHQAAGVDCHHVAFEQDTVDWQLWVDAGERPLPRRLVITYKTEHGVPQYAVTFHEWNLEPVLPDELFVLEIPEDAREVSVPVFVGTEQ